jgi:hypothetical protein
MMTFAYAREHSQPKPFGIAATYRWQLRPKPTALATSPQKPVLERKQKAFYYFTPLNTVK